MTSGLSYWRTEGSYSSNKRYSQDCGEATRTLGHFLNIGTCIRFLHGITNYHKFRGLEHYTFLSGYFCVSKLWPWPNRVLCFSVFQGLAGAHQSLDGDRIYFQTYSDCWQNWFLCSCRNHGSLFETSRRVSAHSAKIESRTIRKCNHTGGILSPFRIPLVRSKSQVLDVLKERRVYKACVTGVTWGHVGRVHF